MDFLAVVTALEEQEALFAELHPRYKALLEAGSTTVASREAVEEESTTSALASLGASRSLAAGGASGPIRLGDLVAGATEIASGKTAITFLEQTNDPRIFRMPVLSQTWDSLRGLPGRAGPEVFVAKLPHFAYDIGRGLGNNALFIQAEYYTVPGYDYTWIAANLAPQESLQRELLCHSNFRIDPVRAAGTTTGAMKRRYVQGFRLATWETKTQSFRNDGADFPIKPGVKFWWRIVVHPAGYICYVDGKPLMFSPHPPRGKPQEWDTLFVQLPLAGEKGEKATWRVHQVWWGACGIHPEEEKAVAKELAETGRDMPAWSKDEVRVSELQPGTSTEEVRAAFAHYNPVALLADSAGSVVMRLADPNAVQYVIKEMEGTTAIRGSPIHVARVLLAKADAPPITGGVAGVAPGAGAGGAGGAGFSAGPGAAGAAGGVYPVASVPFGASSVPFAAASAAYSVPQSTGFYGTSGH